MKIRRREVGKLKLMVERIMGYGSLINFSMILYLYVTESPLGMPWYFWVILIGTMVPVISFIDWKFIWPASLEYIYGKKNKQFTELRDDIRNLKKQLDRMEKI